MFIYAQTVFEGFARNSYEAGLRDLETFRVRGVYAFDPGDPSGKRRSSLMQGYLTRGTPWSIVIDGEGIVRVSEFTARADSMRKAIDQALARLPAKDAPGD